MCALFNSFSPAVPQLGTAGGDKHACKELSMVSHLERSFEKIGATVQIVNIDAQRGSGARGWFRGLRQGVPVSLDVTTNKRGGESFLIRVRQDLARVDLTVLEVRKDERHLVLLAKHFDRDGRPTGKEHFLCGHDERHFFVALVQPVSTVTAAKDSLKPDTIKESEAHLSAAKRNRRKTDGFKRQGEWFFVPAEVDLERVVVRKNEPLRRGNRSKAHIAQFAVRKGGESVKVCSRYPNGLNATEYKELLDSDPSAAYWGWSDMVRDAEVFVKGTVRHPDHATIKLDGWHRVFMNSERVSEAVAFLD
ncbi:MAG TPA: hypothetical protein V6C72_18305 [Chroococcales cyanobacterium]